jgi:hypothetical protein
VSKVIINIQGGFMKKYFLIALVLPSFLIYSCGLLDSDSDKTFSITTEKNSYTVGNEFTANILFKNELSREVSLMYSGCNIPDFGLERIENGIWTFADGPLCAATVFPPRNLRDGKSYSAIVKMYVDKYLISGTYRVAFDIRDKPYGKSIDSAYLYSNSFTISRE